jgi:alkylresorcinol/alkylpyrone synthase
LPFLVAIETLPAPFKHRQSAVAAEVVAWLASADSGADGRVVERLFSRAGVTERSSLKPLPEVFVDATFAERNRVYQEAVIESGVRLARAVLGRAGLDNVDIMVSSSCTGFMIPSVDAHVANALRLGPRLVRLPITEAGCAGGAVALARAADYLEAHPKSVALVLAVEFSSLTFQAKDVSPTNLVAAALFADGGAAAVLVGDDHPAAGRAHARFVGAASYFMPESLGAMGYDVVESGFKLVLDKGLPDFLRGKLLPMVREFLSGHDLTLGQIAAFAVHPGGRKVLDVAAEEIGLSAAQIESSRAILAEHGNMSSATILFVLQRVLDGLGPAEWALGIGFGPGFGIELSLWRGQAAAPTVPPGPPSRSNG